MWAIFLQLVCPFYIFTLPAVLLNPLPVPHANTKVLSTAVFETFGDFTRERTHKFLCSPPDRGALLRHKAVAAPLRSGVCEGHPTFQGSWPLTSTKKDSSLMPWGPDGRNRVSVFVHVRRSSWISFFGLIKMVNEDKYWVICCLKLILWNIFVIVVHPLRIIHRYILWEREDFVVMLVRIQTPQLWTL